MIRSETIGTFSFLIPWGIPIVAQTVVNQPIWYLSLLAAPLRAQSQWWACPSAWQHDPNDRGGAIAHWQMPVVDGGGSILCFSLSQPHFHANRQKQPPLESQTNRTRSFKNTKQINQKAQKKRKKGKIPSSWSHLTIHPLLHSTQNFSNMRCSLFLATGPPGGSTGRVNPTGRIRL